MGNRATVIFEAGDRISPAVYLHWNGGPESVYAFLAELDVREVRADADYECARFVQIVGEFFGHEGLSLGVVNGPAAITPKLLDLVETDYGDNGFYIVDRTRRDGDAVKVRRFTEHLVSQDPWRYELTEMSSADVDREESAAYALDYRTMIADFFTQLRAERLASA